MDNWRINHLLELLTQEPQDEFVMFALAHEYRKIEDYGHAIEYFQRLKLQNAEYLGLYFHLGHCYEELNQFHDAQATYKAGISIATQLNEEHALRELKGALVNLEMEYPDQFS
ncbi:MAG: tetratricopeptide repeat protein [Bacteroidota bacterium]